IEPEQTTLEQAVELIAARSAKGGKKPAKASGTKTAAKKSARKSKSSRKSDKETVEETAGEAEPGAKTKGAPRQATVGRLPSKQEILDYLETASVKAGKREISRAFGVKGGDRVALKELLRSMADDGLIAGSRRKLSKPGALPPVTVIEIVSRDRDGEFV